MDSIWTALGIKTSVLQGAVSGGFIAFVLGDGHWVRRVFRALGGTVMSISGTEAFLELAGHYITATPATERLGGLVFGLIGIYLAEAIIKSAERVRDQTPAMAAAWIRKRLGG